MEKTTIQINAPTLERLKSFKNHNRESYDELINNILDNTEEEALSEEEIREIKEALSEVKEGKTFPIEEVAKEIGVSLM